MATLRTLAVGADGDWIVSSGRRTRWVGDADAIAQAVRFRLSQKRGEWFLDEDLGVDWIGTILGRDVRLDVADRELRRVIAETPGVRSIETLRIEHDTSNRTATVYATLQTDAGALVTVQVQR